MPFSDETYFSLWHMRHVADARRREQRRWLSSLVIAGGAITLVLGLSFIVLRQLAETKGNASEAAPPIQVSLVTVSAPPRPVDPGPLTQPHTSSSRFVPPQIPAPMTTLTSPPLAVPKFQKIRRRSKDDKIMRSVSKEKSEAPPAEKATAPPASENAANRHDVRQATASNGAQDTWMGQVYARLKAFRRYPSEAKIAGIEGKVGIWFVFDRKGHILASGLASSSGNEELDAAAVALPEAADPIPLPADPNRLTYPYRMTIRIGYKLR